MMSLPTFPDQNRPDRAVIAITGEVALAWLNNLLTCDVSTLGVGSAAYGALLSPQGKILHDIFVFRDERQVLIDCAAGQRAALLQKLSTYRLRAKLMIEINNNLEVGVHLNKPDDGLRYVDPRHSDMGWRSIVPTGSLINAIGNAKCDERRIVLGLANSVHDIGSDKVFPHEVNFDQFGGVDFKKGCYVGQEVVSRMQHRGTARNRMLPVKFDDRPDAKTIMAGGKVIGEIHSCTDHCGLALIRLDRLAEAARPLMAGATVVHVEKPEWIKIDVAV